MSKINGIIIKGIGGFYFVKTHDGTIHKCRARGNFRIKDLTPLPGDMVEIIPQTGEELGYVEEILPRKNRLIRPAVANIDCITIFVSASKPKADLLLVDKLLLFAFMNGIKPVICINKCDTGESIPKDICSQYEKVCKVICISAKNKEGIENLEAEWMGKCVCLAGQSAVGKTTTINTIAGLSLETGGLSKKTARGRHTTRHAELLPVEKINATIIDTPGFSLIDTIDIEPEELELYYPDFTAHLGNCRFDSCVHDREPDCAIKQAVKNGKINKIRYDRYLEILKELKEKRANKYV